MGNLLIGIMAPKLALKGSDNILVVCYFPSDSEFTKRNSSIHEIYTPTNTEVDNRIY